MILPQLWLIAQKKSWELSRTAINISKTEVAISNKREQYLPRFAGATPLEFRDTYRLDVGLPITILLAFRA